MKAFLILLDIFLDVAAEKLFFTDDEVENLFGALMDALPEPLKKNLLTVGFAQQRCA